MEIAEVNIAKELIHADCGAETAGCQAEERERPKACPYCGGETFQRWGGVNKPVKDIRVRTVQVYRYRCCQCQRTFRHYPEGKSVADQTER
jgi:DNA-directed RNA polymerase subunit RPC12/RpoP